MSYQIVRDGLSSILKAQGLAESLVALDFKDSPITDLENTFILNCKEGEADGDNDQQQAFLYDNQTWTVQIAFGTNSESVIVQRDAINRKKDSLLTELDDPANWKSFCMILRYRSWSIEKQDKFFILTIQLKVKDALTY